MAAAMIMGSVSMFDQVHEDDDESESGSSSACDGDDEGEQSMDT